MGSITMSGFNNIDWNTVLEAVMTQEAQPLTTMQSQRTAMSSRSTAFSNLAGYLGGLEDAAYGLSSAMSFGGRTATSTDQTVVSASTDSQALVGTYDVVVTKLARAQVTTTTPASAVASTDTVVATGGSLTINGRDVTLTGDTTLEGLAAAINGTADIGVRATLIQADSKYQMVLTGTTTGAANSFTVTNGLTGSTLAFDTVNAVNASDADVTVNNVRMTSTTNTIKDAAPGVTLTLYKESTSPEVISVGVDSSNIKDKLKGFVSAYNDLVSFMDSQMKSASAGSTGTIGRDSMLRMLRAQLNSTILTSSSIAGEVTNLAEVGIGFQRDGKLTFDESTFDEKAETLQSDIERMFAGDGTTGGVFDAIQATVQDYTKAGGLVPDATQRLTEEMARLDGRITSMEARLALRRVALQKEYAAADEVISTLNSQKSSLSSLGSGYSLY